jgi:hypothetical protein
MAENMRGKAAQKEYKEALGLILIKYLKESR